MPYHGFPYFVAKSIGARRSSNSSTPERHALPERRRGVRYTASVRGARYVSPHRPCDTVCPSKAHGIRANAKMAISEIQPLRAFAVLLLMALIALTCVAAGIGVAQVLAGTLDNTSMEGRTSTTATGPTATSPSTPLAAWKQGEVPQLYLTDTQWSSQPYGSGTIGTKGSALLCLAMVRINLTGDVAAGPIEVASFAQHQGYADHADASALLTDGVTDMGLTAQSVAATELDIRRRINAGTPLICALDSDVFGEHTTYVVLSGIDEHGRLVIVDPSSVERTAQHWAFDDIIPASTGLWAYALTT